MKLSTFLSGVVVVGLLLVLFIPLFVSNSLFFPFITGKNFAFRIIVEIIFGAWLVGLLYAPESFKPKLSWINMSLVGLTLIATLAAIFGENPYRSFWSNYERMDGLITTLHLLAYTIVLTSTLISGKLWDWLLHTSMGAALIVSLYGFAQLAGWTVINQGGVRLDATLGNATYLAAYVLFHLFIAIYYFVHNYHISWTRYVYAILGLVYAVILYNTATRGAIFGTIAGLIVTALIMGLKSPGRVRKISFSFIGVVALCGVLFLGLQNTSLVKDSPVLSRFALSALTNPDQQPRLIIWKLSMKGALERPILGWGQEAFNVVFNKYFDSRLWRQETWFDRSHNVLIDWLVTTGIFGLGLYLGLFASSVFLLWKASAKPLLERAILIGLFVAYFIHNIFVFDNIVSYIVFFLVLSFIHHYSMTSGGDYIAQRINLSQVFAWAEPLAGAYRSVVATTLLIVLVFVIYFANVRPIQANHLMLRALYNPRAITAEKLPLFNKLFAMKTFGSMETREQLLLFLSEQRGNPNVDRALLVPLLDLAQAQMELQLKQSETDARHQLFLGSFMSTWGRVAEALTVLENARKLSPGKQLIHFNIGRAQIALGRYDDAFNTAKQAYELDTSYDKAALEYIAAAIYNRKQDVADSIMKEKFGTTLLPDPVIIQAYVGTNQINKIIDLWAKRVELEPNVPQNYYSLAATYYVDKQDAKAISTLRKLIKVVPLAKETAESYISQITSGTLPRQ